MAYVVERKGGSWEVRESRATPDGPRSRTLATFRVLTPDVVERARGRASGPLGPEEVRRAALRAGAPVAEPAADRAARDLLRELAAGRRPQPVLGRLVAGALGAREAGPPSDAARSAAAWAGATAEERAAALRDLLLLVDSLPPRKRERGRRFPRLDSGAAR